MNVLLAVLIGALPFVDVTGTYPDTGKKPHIQQAEPAYIWVTREGQLHVGYYWSIPPECLPVYYPVETDAYGELLPPLREAR